MYSLKRITKWEAATRQIDAAIRLHFENRDPLAVCALTSGAHRIFADLAERSAARSWDREVQEELGVDATTYYALLRAESNFLKHADRDANATLDVEAGCLDDRIMIALANAGPLDKLSTAGQVFHIWYLARHSDGKLAARFSAATDKMFPGIREMSPDQQRAYGLRRLIAAQERVAARRTGARYSLTL